MQLVVPQQCEGFDSFLDTGYRVKLGVESGSLSVPIVTASCCLFPPPPDTSSPCISSLSVPCFPHCSFLLLRTHQAWVLGEFHYQEGQWVLDRWVWCEARCLTLVLAALPSSNGEDDLPHFVSCCKN
jgi:hypothetical protein